MASSAVNVLHVETLQVNKHEPIFDCFNEYYFTNEYFPSAYLQVNARSRSFMLTILSTFVRSCSFMLVRVVRQV